MTQQKKTSSYTVGIGLFLLVLLAITCIAYWQQVRLFPEQMMSNDIHQLAMIFNKINDTCGILDFQSDHTEVDFLNVIAFKGSEVGAMNLKFPSKWEGPYVRDNPTIQEKHYQIVNTKKGYFIIPGNGVALKNGLIIGKDIIIDKNTDITELIRDKSLVDSAGKPLALPIPTLNQPSSILLEDLFMYASHKLPFLRA
jgi:hypothetical protein